MFVACNNYLCYYVVARLAHRYDHVGGAWRGPGDAGRRLGLLKGRVARTLPGTGHLNLAISGPWRKGA